MKLLLFVALLGALVAHSEAWYACKRGDYTCIDNRWVTRWCNAAFGGGCSCAASRRGPRRPAHLLCPTDVIIQFAGVSGVVRGRRVQSPL